MAGLASAGAAMGSAVMPGMGSAIGGALGSIGDMFMGGGGTGGGGGYSPQDAQSAIYGDLGLDSSGWNVNFKGTQSNGSNKAGTPSMSDSLGLTGLGGAAFGGLPPMVLIGGAVLLGVMLWKKSKSKK